jgi:hypothetical protein
MRARALALVLGMLVAGGAHAAAFLVSADAPLEDLRRGRFAPLDAALDELARDGVRMDDGRRAIDATIARAVSMLAADDTLLPRLAAWRKVSHRPWAEIAQARLEVELAFRARGGGASHGVSEAAWAVYRKHLEAAEAAIARARRLAPDAPEPLAERVRLALYESQGHPEVAARFEAAIAADPGSFVAQEGMYLAASPFWGGSAELRLAFARGAAQRSPADPWVRALLVRAHEAALEGQPPHAKLVYYRRPEIAQEALAAAEAVVAALPESEYGHNLLAFVAMRSGRRDVVRRELQWIGDRHDARVWTGEEFAGARGWAASGAVRPPNRPPAAPTP